MGKILTIEIVFNYRGDDDGPSMSVSRTVEKRGRVSATSRTLAECERLIHNEEENTGRPATWDLAYGFMRCDVRSCPLNVVIPGSREAAVREYCKWLESRATDEAYKADFRKICQVTLENHLDLKLILEDPHSGFFVQRGIQIGTARRFLRDVNEWATVMSSNKLD